MPTLLPTPVPTDPLPSAMPTPAPSNEGCFKNEVLLDFHTANLTVNNLGGRGPNTGKAEEMRFSRVGQIDSEDLDLVITAYNSSQYYGVATSNGKSGEFGQTNQAVGKSSEFQFKFEFKHCADGLMPFQGSILHCRTRAKFKFKHIFT